MTINTDIQKLEPGAIVELFEMDATLIGGDIARFHRHTGMGSIFWNSKEYSPWPIKAEGFERTSDKPPNPKLTVANLDSSISALCYEHDDMVGTQLTRTRTLGKYLDAVNFVDGQSLLVNGDLRDDVAGWTITGPGTFNWLSMGQARLSGLTGLTKAYQDIAVTPGVEYLLKVKIVSRIGSAPVRAYDGASFAGTFGAVNTAGITNTINITPTTSTIRVSIEAAAGAEILVSNLTLHKFIGNPSANPSEEFAPEIWFIERKASESNEAVEFELVSAMELNGVKLPRRQIIANYCSWLSMGGYRGPYCNYTGIAVAKADGTPTSSMSLDKCGGKLSDCKLRQWPDGVLNFGGFPAAGLMRT